MPTHGRISSRPRATWPHGSGDMRARTPSWPTGQDLYYGRPLYVVIGRTAIVARARREYGPPCCVADVASAQLARPRGERGIVGHFAANWLFKAGRRP